MGYYRQAWPQLLDVRQGSVIKLRSLLEASETTYNPGNDSLARPERRIAVERSRFLGISGYLDDLCPCGEVPLNAFQTRERTNTRQTGETVL